MNGETHQSDGPNIGELGESHFNFQKELLEAHNKYRKEHGCYNLSWNPELAEQAQAWAEKISERGHLMYSETQGLGENIMLFPIDDPERLCSGNEVAECWAKERDKYNFDRPGWQPGTNHFTQMVWKNSHEIGIGRSLMLNETKVVVVAFYKPGGNTNWPGDFAANVPRVMSKHSVD